MMNVATQRLLLHSLGRRLPNLVKASSRGMAVVPNWRPVSMEEYPVPVESFEKGFKKRDAINNKVLGIGIVVFVASVLIAGNIDGVYWWSPPPYHLVGNKSESKE